jgi:predicted lipoprotein with Yx(FWY)xxD motif
MTRTRLASLRGAAVAGGLVLALAACGSTSTPTAAESSASAPASSAQAAATSTVKVGSTSLGNVVVDAKGMTLYMFTKDTQNSGKSACTGQCLVAWPPLFTDGTPTGEGVSGALATITTPDGKKQVTLNGWPLYYYAKDKKPGDTTGQDVQEVWYVLDSSGTPLKDASSSSSPSSSSGGGGGY